MFRLAGRRSQVAKIIPHGQEGFIASFSQRAALWDGPYDAPYRRPYICGLRTADGERRTPHAGAPTFTACGRRTADTSRGRPYICGLRTANGGRPTRAPLQRKKDLPIGQVLFPYICNPSRNFSKIFCSSSVRSRPRSMWSSSPLLRALSCSCLSPLLALSSRMITLTPP